MFLLIKEGVNVATPNCTKTPPTPPSVYLHEIAPEYSHISFCFFLNILLNFETRFGVNPAAPLERLAINM